MKLGCYCLARPHPSRKRRGVWSIIDFSLVTLVPRPFPVEKKRPGLYNLPDIFGFYPFTVFYRCTVVYPRILSVIPDSFSPSHTELFYGDFTARRSRPRQWRSHTRRSRAVSGGYAQSTFPCRALALAEAASFRCYSILTACGNGLGMLIVRNLLKQPYSSFCERVWLRHCRGRDLRAYSHACFPRQSLALPGVPPPSQLIIRLTPRDRCACWTAAGKA